MLTAASYPVKRTVTVWQNVPRSWPHDCRGSNVYSGLPQIKTFLLFWFNTGQRSTPRMCIDHVNIITNKWPKFIVVTYYDQTCLCADWQWDERFTPCASVAQTVCTHAPYFIPPVSPSAFIQCQQIQPSLVSYIPYWHLYNTCHITFTLHVYDLTSMSGCAAGGGGVIAGQLPSHG